MRRAYAAGSIVVRQPVIEMASGNMGTRLAVVCGVLGNQFTAMMWVGNSPDGHE
jgi:cysteine synthase A